MVEVSGETANRNKAATAARAFARPRGGLNDVKLPRAEKWWARRDSNPQPDRYERPS
jgi:hypothetical protein